ncbi:serine/threonine-protein kinase pim-2 isoform X2 [Oryzias latipes]
MENSTELHSICEEHISGVVQQHSSFAEKDGTTSRKRKSSAEEVPAGKKLKLSQTSSSQEPKQLDSESDSEHISGVVQQRSSFAEKDGTTSRKRKSSAEEVPAGKKIRLSQTSSSQEPRQLDSESESKCDSSSEAGSSSQEKSSCPRKSWKSHSSCDALLEVKYKKEGLLGEGGYGSVYAGYRISDGLPVAIKYIPSENVIRDLADDGKQLPTEVAIMLKAADGRNGPVGTSASVSLLDFYDLEDDLILVLERPNPVESLFEYSLDKDNLEEKDTKIIMEQIVQGLKELEEKNIFHRDIKLENILIETGSDVPRARLIDFGMSSFTERDTVHEMDYDKADHDPPEFNFGSYSAGPTTVWQLGVVLYEVMHGDLFNTNDFLEKKQEISQELSRECKNFLEQCLAPLPENRPTLDELLLHPWLQR